MEAVDNPVRRPGGRSARVRAAVIEATIDELVEHGYAGMTMQAIAERAGVNKTSLYRRWGSKGALLADALVANSSEIEAPRTGDVRTDLMILWATVPAAREGDDFSRPVAVSRALAAAGNDPDVAMAHQALWDERARLITIVVDRAIAAGQLPPGTDADLLMDLLFGAFHARVVVRGEVPTPGFARQVMEAVLRSAGAG